MEYVSFLSDFNLRVHKVWVGNIMIPVLGRWAFCFSPTAECYGVFAQYRFGVFWASWGDSVKEMCSGNRFRELVPGTGSGRQVLPFQGTSSGFRWVPTGFAVPRNRVPDTKVPGSEGCVPESSKVSMFDGL